MGQPGDLRIESQSSFTLLLRHFELPLLVLTDIFDLDLSTKRTVDLVICFEDDAFQLSDLFLKSLKGRFALS